MRSTGTALFLLGLAVGLYGFFMDTTVDAPDLARINNIGLMNERLIFLFIGGVMCIMGSIFLAAVHVSDAIKNAEKAKAPVPYTSVKPEVTANAEQINLQQKYERGEIPFEVFQSEWERLRN